VGFPGGGGGEEKEKIGQGNKIFKEKGDTRDYNEVVQFRLGKER